MGTITVRAAGEHTTITYSRTPGQYLPDDTNTGPATVNLPAYNDPDVDRCPLKDGTEIVGRLIHGDIQPLGDVRISQCVAVGGRHTPTYSSGVFEAFNSRGGLLWVEDTLIKPRRPSLNRDGIVGHQYRAYRNQIVDVIDGLGSFITPNKGTRANTQAVANWVRGHVYFHPDYINGTSGATRHPDGPHTDGWQHQGGLDALCWGNRMDGYARALPGSGVNPAKPWLLTPPNRWANGAGIIVQDNTGAGLDGSVQVVENWFTGYLAHVNMKPGTYEVSRNHHYLDVAHNPDPLYSRYYIRGASRSRTTIIGLNTNRWAEGPNEGQPLTEPRPDGISWDTL